jgi:hypothetical protein
MTSTANAARPKARPQPAALNFGIDYGDRGGRQIKDGERLYRIELADGREAVVMATRVTIGAGGTLVAHTDVAARPADNEFGLPAHDALDEHTLILAPGTWLSAYMCEVILGVDPWAIGYLPAPGPR